MKFEKYVEINAINSHLLKLCKNPKDLREHILNPNKDNTKTIPQIIGDATDCLLTSPTTFRERFKIYRNLKYPTDTLVDIINDTIKNIKYRYLLPTLYEMSVEDRHEYITDMLVKSSKQLNYQSRWTDEVRYRNIKESCLDYAIILLDNIKSNRTIIDDNTFKSIKRAYKIFVNNIRFPLHKDNVLPHIKVYRQYYIKWFVNIDEEEIECKALLDFLFVNTKRKVVKFADLKVTALPALNYYTEIVSRDIYIQLAFYYDAVQYLINNSEEFKGYKQELPKILVVSYTSNQLVTYNINAELITVGKYGNNLKTIPLMGYKERIKAFFYHTRSDNYDYPYYIKDSKEINLKLFANDDIS